MNVQKSTETGKNWKERAEKLDKTWMKTIRIHTAKALLAYTNLTITHEKEMTPELHSKLAGPLDWRLVCWWLPWPLYSFI